jgi:hypothetical protein
VIAGLRLIAAALAAFLLADVAKSSEEPSRAELAEVEAIKAKVDGDMATALKYRTISLLLLLKDVPVTHQIGRLQTMLDDRSVDALDRYAATVGLDSTFAIHAPLERLVCI